MKKFACIIMYLSLQLVGAPSAAVAQPAAAGKVAQAESAGNADGGIDADLQARLDNLRKM
jgi:charged multivesicular body protein 2A